MEDDFSSLALMPNLVPLGAVGPAGGVAQAWGAGLGPAPMVAYAGAAAANRFAAAHVDGSGPWNHQPANAGAVDAVGAMAEMAGTGAAAAVMTAGGGAGEASGAAHALASAEGGGRWGHGDQVMEAGFGGIAQSLIGAEVRAGHSDDAHVWRQACAAKNGHDNIENSGLLAPATGVPAGYGGQDGNVAGSSGYCSIGVLAGEDINVMLSILGRVP